jgi:uncharacterized protein
MTYPSTLSAWRTLQRITTLFLFVLSFSLCPQITAGQIPSPQPNTYVNDFAKVLSPEDIEDLNEKIYAIEKGYTVQIAVVLITQLPEGMEIEDFARGIGREWHAGIDRRGLVYVASIGQNKQRLEVAANLEGIIPDITAHAIMDSLKPFLRRKDYTGALKDMLAEIGQRLQAEQKQPAQTGQAAAPADPSSSQDVTPVEQDGGGLTYHRWMVPVFIILLGPLITVFYWLLGGRRMRQTSSNYYTGRNSWTSYDSAASSGDSGSAGGSNSSGSNDYGDWGGGSDSSSSSSDSGFDGGGSSNDW